MKHSKNRTLRFFLAFIIPFSLCFAYCYGQASDSASTSGSVGSFISSIPKWIPIVAVGVYETLVRLFPTSKNLSLVTLIFKIIKGILPNNKTDGGTHDASK